MKSKSSDVELTRRSIKIIENGGRIVLRKQRHYELLINNDNDNVQFFKKYDLYLHQSTDIAAGPDQAQWCYRKAKHSAKEFFNLKLAYTIAPLYNCDVVIFYPK